MNVISKAKSKTTKNRYSLLVRMKGSIFVTRKNEKQQQKKNRGINGAKMDAGLGKAVVLLSKSKGAG